MSPVIIAAISSQVFAGTAIELHPLAVLAGNDHDSFCPCFHRSTDRLKAKTGPIEEVRAGVLPTRTVPQNHFMKHCGRFGSMLP